MGFHEIQFPTSLSQKSRFGPAFNTSIVDTFGGESYRIARWANARRRYNVGYKVKSKADIYAIYEFYLARLGPANGFRFKDWLDYTTGADGDGTFGFRNVVLGTGDGSKVDFQLIKKYTSGAQIVTRTITKPVNLQVKAGINAVEKTLGTDFNVDYTTGILTWDPSSIPPAGQEVTAGFEFDVPVHFEGELDDNFAIALATPSTAEVTADIPIVERINDLYTPGEFYYGSGSAFTMAADKKYDFSMGSAVSISVTTAGHKLILPAKANLELGEQHIVIYNHEASTQTFDIYDEEAATTVVTALAAGNAAEMYLYDNAGTKTWLGVG